MFVIKYRKWFFSLSIILTALAIYGMFVYGFKLGIDFKGGTITEARYVDIRPDKGEVERAIGKLDLGGFSVRPSGTDRYIIRTQELDQKQRSQLVESLAVDSVSRDEELNMPVIERQNTVGPVAGSTLANKAVKAILLVILMIVLFITFAFRKVSQPVVSWKYGLATIIALAHDVIIPTGVFVFLGRLYGLEIDLLFVGGLLAILGYSVHDTIVVFDRVRENLRINKDTNKNEVFESTVGRSVTETMVRSINTSLTILIMLCALYFVGSSATKDFSLLLLIGIIAGTYSSIFLASPLLVTFYKLQNIQNK